MKNDRFFVTTTLFIAPLIWFGYFLSRTDFVALILLVFAMFVSYILLVKRANEKQLHWVFIASRVVLLLAIPNLSDDYLRFFWDGRLIGLEENPYLHLPSWYIEQGIYSEVLTSQLFESMNSPDYFTVYPPVSQAIFYISTLFGDREMVSVVVMRLFIIGAEFGIIYFGKCILNHFGLSRRNIYLYALNPLIILEMTGNLHFEAIMLFFLLGAIYLLLIGKWQIAALFFAFSVGTKLLPLMILPLLIFPFGLVKTLKFGLVSTVGIVLMFLPFISDELMRNFMSSIGLYFRRFEFNASIYFIIRWIGFKLTGYNLIQSVGAILPVLVLLSIIILAWLNRKTSQQKIFTLIMFAFLIYLLSASIVHPWYVSTLILMACFSRYRFAIIWSFTAFFSYWAYRTPAYQENLWLITMEYLFVALALFYELKSSDNQVLNVDILPQSKQK